MGAVRSKIKNVDNPEGLLRMPPDADGAVTAKWLTGELAKAGEHVDLDDVRVEQLTAANIDNVERQDGGGISGSRILRLRLIYTEGGRRLSSGAETLVLKWTDFAKVPPMHINMRVAQTLLFKVNQADLFRTEHYFLTNVAGKVHDSWGVATPKTYDTSAQHATEPPACFRLICDSRSKLITMSILEDVGKYKSLQPFSNIPRAKAKAALRNIAKLHRATWGQHGKYQADLSAIYGRNGFCIAHIGLYGLRGSGVWPKKQKFQSLKAPEGLHTLWGLKNSPGTDEGLNIIKKIAMDDTIIGGLKNLRQHWDKVFPHMGSIEPQCCVHGDFHHWNNMFGRDNDEDVMLIDWQYFGAGRVAYDLVYFFNCGIDPTTYEDDLELLRIYHSTLVSPEINAPPIRDYPFEKFLTEFRTALIDNVTTLCISYGTRTMGIAYGPKDYKAMADDPKQRDFVVGGQMLSGRLYERFKQLYLQLGSFEEGLGFSPTMLRLDEDVTPCDAGDIDDVEVQKLLSNRSSGGDIESAAHYSSI